jgi:hypothetical protein
VIQAVFRPLVSTSTPSLLCPTQHHNEGEAVTTTNENAYTFRQYRGDLVIELTIRAMTDEERAEQHAERSELDRWEADLGARGELPRNP